MKENSKSLTIGIGIVIIIETLCATYLLKHPRYSSGISIVYFLSGILISFLLLFLPQVRFKNQDAGSPFVRYASLILILFTAVYCFYYTRYWIGTTPLSYEYADMLPMIKVMDERFLSGHINQVYQPIPEIWGGAQSAYFPAMWLPYCAGVIANIDLRWINSFALFTSFAICLFIARQTKNLWAAIIFITNFLILVAWLYTESVHNFIRLTEEGVVVLYYMLFFLAIISRKPVLIGVSLGFCLLSRFSIIGWIPAITIYFLLQKRFKELLLIGGSCLLIILLLLILPFGWSTTYQIMQRASVYMLSTSNVWEQHPEYFTNYLGFARFFIPGHLKSLHHTLITVSFLLPMLFVFICHYLKKRSNINNVLLATGKLSLVVFYSFIYVPYLYLFYTSSMVSLLIAAFLARNGKREMV